MGERASSVPEPVPRPDAPTTPGGAPGPDAAAAAAGGVEAVGELQGLLDAIAAGRKAAEEASSFLQQRLRVGASLLAALEAQIEQANARQPPGPDDEALRRGAEAAVATAFRRYERAITAREQALLEVDDQIARARERAEAISRLVESAEVNVAVLAQRSARALAQAEAAAQSAIAATAKRREAPAAAPQEDGVPPAADRVVELKPRTAARVVADIAAETSLSRRKVAAVLESMAGLVRRDLGPGGRGRFRLPGIATIEAVSVPGSAKPRLKVVPLRGVA